MKTYANQTTARLHNETISCMIDLPAGVRSEYLPRDHAGNVIPSGDPNLEKAFAAAARAQNDISDADFRHFSDIMDAYLCAYSAQQHAEHLAQQIVPSLISA